MAGSPAFLAACYLASVSHVGRDDGFAGGTIPNASNMAPCVRAFAVGNVCLCVRDFMSSAPRLRCCLSTRTRDARDISRTFASFARLGRDNQMKGSISRLCLYLYSSVALSLKRGAFPFSFFPLFQCHFGCGVGGGRRARSSSVSRPVTRPVGVARRRHRDRLVGRRVVVVDLSTFPISICPHMSKTAHQISGSQLSRNHPTKHARSRCVGITSCHTDLLSKRTSEPLSGSRSTKSEPGTSLLKTRSCPPS